MTGLTSSTVLAEGQSSYPLVAGSNSLPAMSLNGVVAGASFSVTGCSASGDGPTPPTIDTCAGNVILSDAAADAIVYSGPLEGPFEGQNPTTGTVYNNDGGNSSEVSFTSSSVSGTVSGTAQSPFSSYASAS
jgi:hypothetical protein